jgi:hypothetical protein
MRFPAAGSIDRNDFQVYISELPVLFQARPLADGNLFCLAFSTAVRKPTTSPSRAIFRRS